MSVAAQTKNDFYEDNINRVDIEDYTTSSILDFLNKENQCNNNSLINHFEGLEIDSSSELDVESIFEEINRLSDNADCRSVEEIIHEAELLMGEQKSIQCNGDNYNRFSELEFILKQNDNKANGMKSAFNDFKHISHSIDPSSTIINEPAPNIMKNNSKNLDGYESNGADKTIEEATNNKAEGIATSTLTVQKNSTLINVNNKANENDDRNNKTDVEENYNLPTRSSDTMRNSLAVHESNSELFTKTITTTTVELYSRIKNKSQEKAAIKSSPSSMLNSPPSTPPSASKLPVQYKRPHSTQSLYNDKRNFALSLSSSASSMNSVKTPRTSPPPSATTSNDTNGASCREHTLKMEISMLQEKLKDTEERLHSLRLQHDSLSQIHRDLRDTHNSRQSETEMLKLDVQHLNECAKKLRSELQAARSDRDETLNVLKNIQSENADNDNEKKKLHEKSEKDTKIIQDLQRQCKEMERILMRKHPDSVSALIVASKNCGNPNNDNSASRRLLEQRIAQLEADAKEQDAKAQKILANVQAKFYSVQSKYETHIADLETQVLSLQEINTNLNEKIEFQIVSLNNFTKSSNNFQSSSTQTHDFAERETDIVETASQTDISGPISGTTPKKVLTSKNTITKKSIKSTNGKNETIAQDQHLLSTIRSMRIDLAIKEKALIRLTRELSECKKTIAKMQKEKEVSKPDKQLQSSSNTRKNYDPMHYLENQSSNNDNQLLRETLSKCKLLEYDYKALHDKRLQDLKTLQAAHERELSSCQETVQILQKRLIERDEAFANQKRCKVPIDYYALKAKVTSLERRHSEREKRLHMLVEALSKGHLNGTFEDLLNDKEQSDPS